MRILSRFLNGNFELLEPYEGKLSRTVLRGESGSNAADLLDNLSVKGNFLKKKDDEQQRKKGHKKNLRRGFKERVEFNYSRIWREVPVPSFLLFQDLNHILHFLHSRL